MPKVSICIPTYENPEEVSRLLTSIRQQTFTDYEAILTDDSRDGRIEAMIGGLRETEREFGDRLRYVHNPRPLGHIFNWNEALSHARGEYIKIMFSDDWFAEPDSLTKMVQALDEHPQAGLVFTGNFQVSKEKRTARLPEAGYTDRLRQDYRYLFVSNQIGAPSNTMYRRGEGIAFDEKSNWASDVFLYMEILKRNREFVFLAEPLICIGIHEHQYTESFSSSDPRIFKDYQYMFVKYGLTESPELREYFLTKYLVRYRDGAREAAACGYSRREFCRAKGRYLRREALPCYVYAVKRRLGGKPSGKC